MKKNRKNRKTCREQESFAKIIQPEGHVGGGRGWGRWQDDEKGLQKSNYAAADVVFVAARNWIEANAIVVYMDMKWTQPGRIEGWGR